MATITELTLSKGEYTVTVYANQIEDGFRNNIFKIIIPVGKQNQASGPRVPKIVDLLRIERTWRILGYIINNADKNKLIKIIEGGGIAGGGVTFSYSDGGDATSFTVFVEACIITQKAADEPTIDPSDFAKFDINMTLIKGTVV